MGTETIVELETRTEIVVENVGPRGPNGPPGAPGKAFDFIQTLEREEWVIAHNLGFLPSVSTLSTGGAEIVGSVQHLSINVLVISFLVPIAGTAHLV